MIEKLDPTSTNISAASYKEAQTCLTAQEMVNQARDTISISKALAENAIAHAEQSRTLVDMSRIRIKESRSLMREL